MLDTPFRLRRSLFEPQTSGINPRSLSFDDQQQEQEPREDYGLADVYSRLANAEPGPAQKRYRDFLENEMPTREQYKPSKTARLAAILGGVGEGIQNGAGRGLEVTNRMMDSGYNDAVNDFKMGADRFGKSAELEEKDINNRVKTYRDIIQDQIAQREDARKSRLTDAQIGNYQSLAKDRESQQATRGWNYFTDQNAGGSRYGVRVGPSGQLEKVNAGQASPTLEDIGNVEGAKEKARYPFQANLARIRGDETRKNIQERFKQATDLIKFKNDNPNYKAQTLSDGSIVFVNPKDPRDMIITGLSSGKLGDKEKADLGLEVTKKKEDIKANTTTVKTTEEKGGKTTTTTKKEVGKRVRMIDPDGKEWNVDESEVAEAEKNHWKRK